MCACVLGLDRLELIQALFIRLSPTICHWLLCCWQRIWPPSRRPSGTSYVTLGWGDQWVRWGGLIVEVWQERRNGGPRFLDQSLSAGGGVGNTDESHTVRQEKWLLHVFTPQQLSTGWCATTCVRTTAVGARGPTSASPAATSNEAAPAWSPATCLTGENRVQNTQRDNCVDRQQPTFMVYEATLICLSMRQAA